MRRNPLPLLIALTIGCIAGCIVGCGGSDSESFNENRIRPYDENPFYWQYHGEPVMLIGASKDDNLFQQADLRAHLRDMASAGGNYIRNTMSSRDVGGGNEVREWLRSEDGRFDLSRPNPEYWNRLDSLLTLTREPGIFVQVEVWATHDLFGEQWRESGWNPLNNVNYTLAKTSLDSTAPERAFQPHPFFFTVPGVNGDTAVLKYQRAFVDELLRRSLQYDHVLYCITNEIQHAQPPEWSWYWARYMQETAAAAGKGIEVTEMYWAPDMKDDQHRLSLDYPGIYTYFEASQNSAKSDRENWDNLQYVRDALSQDPLPVNSVKIYGKTDATVKWPGTNEEAVDRFWRNILGGCASSRFHRNENGVYGLGLSEISRNSVTAARKFTDAFPPWKAVPAMHLPDSAGGNRVYAAEIPGEAVAVYLTDSAMVQLDLSGLEKKLVIYWTEVLSGREFRAEAEGGRTVTLIPPARGKWLALVK